MSLINVVTTHELSIDTFAMWREEERERETVIFTFLNLKIHNYNGTFSYILSVYEEYNLSIQQLGKELIKYFY